MSGRIHRTELGQGCLLLPFRVCEAEECCKSVGIEKINPLTTEFFPPRQHIFMHSPHTTFVGTPLPQHSLLSGQTWWGPHTWRDPSGNTINDIHDPPQGQQSEVKGGRQPDFRPAFPYKLGPDLTDGTPYTTNLHVFLRPWVGSMNIVRIKNSRANESH